MFKVYIIEKYSILPMLLSIKCVQKFNSFKTFGKLTEYSEQDISQNAYVHRYAVGISRSLYSQKRILWRHIAPWMT